MALAVMLSDAAASAPTLLSDKAVIDVALNSKPNTIFTLYFPPPSPLTCTLNFSPRTKWTCGKLDTAANSKHKGNQ